MTESSARLESDDSGNLGRVRRLDRLTDTDGILKILAIDHRDSLRAVLAPDDPYSITSEQISNIKVDIVNALGDLASGAMLDPVYGLLPVISSGALPGDTGFMTALEAQGYLGDPESRATTLLDGWSVEKAVRVGADAVKLLIFYHPDSVEAAARQRDTVASVVSHCRAADIPLFLEPMLYEVESGRDPSKDRRSLVIDSASELSPLGADVMKMQFPMADTASADEAQLDEACRELDQCLEQPWALLSGGDPIEEFLRQVKAAGRSGCSGFMAGRAVWGDCLPISPVDRLHALASTARSRFSNLCSVAAESCRPLHDRQRRPQLSDDEWYSRY